MPKVSGNSKAVKNRISDQPDQTVLSALRIGFLTVPIKGTAPLIQNRRSEQLRKTLIAKGQKKGGQATEARNPKDIYLNAMHVMPGYAAGAPNAKYGIPAAAFKKSMVRAAKQTDIKNMTDASCCFTAIATDGYLIPMKFHRVRMQSDDGKNKITKNAVVIHRPAFDDWSCDLTIKFNAAWFSKEQILNLIRIAGYFIGILEWTPRVSGSYGTFEIDASKQIRFEVKET